MKKWEYQIFNLSMKKSEPLTVQRPVDPRELQLTFVNQLNELGEEGWEIYYIEGYCSAVDFSYLYKVYVKREKL